jgi:uncharacterized protein (TIGR02145 family)
MKNSANSQIPSVKIGKQVWMKRNLDVTVFNNGDPILQIETAEEWMEAGEKKIPACCYYENDSSYGEVFGMLYNWYAVSDPRGLAPIGWRIPDENDFQELADSFGGDSDAGVELKSTSSRWENYGVEEDEDCKGTNKSGFNGLPGGSRGECRGEDFFAMGGNGDWWSLTEDPDDTTCALKRGLAFDSMEFDKASQYKYCGFSVRCLK